MNTKAIRVVCHVTDHDASEWQRMAADAYRTGRNFFGHRYSVAAAIYRGKDVTPAIYDGLQTNYRIWLNWGWSGIENGIN